MPTQYPVSYNMPMPETLVLEPEQSQGYEIVLALRNDRFGDPQAKAYLVSSDVSFPLRQFGQYRLYVMVHQSPIDIDRLDDRMRKRYHAEHWWSGRAVSDPVTVTIRADDMAQHSPPRTRVAPQPATMTHEQLLAQNAKLLQNLRELQSQNDVLRMKSAELTDAIKALRVHLQNLEGQLDQDRAQRMN